MRILFVDIASHAGLIAAVTPDAIAASQLIDHRITDREFTPTIDRVLEQAAWEHGDVTNIACVTGPGGFTSLRVGVSAANALAWALGVPLYGIHLSNLYYSRSIARPNPNPNPNPNIVWLHSTKKTHLFHRGFGAYAAFAPDARLATIDDARSMIPTDAPLVGELIPDHESAFAARGQHLQDLPSVSAVLPTFLATLPYDRKPLAPWYGRGI